jgi:hypothetical protein
MRIKLTEQTKRFVESLEATDRTKLIITEEAIESSDEDMSKKWDAFLVAEFKNKMREIGEEIKEFNKQLFIDHPEYFEN